jgi:hypothetical protein
MISNNIVESYNSWIKDVRDKPLITMLEIIRRKLMNISHCMKGAKQATNEICPKIQKKLERLKDLQRCHICRWIEEVEFEVVHCHDARRVVNPSNMTCSCGRW